jgi:hypothetical protein
MFHKVALLAFASGVVLTTIFVTAAGASTVPRLSSRSETIAKSVTVHSTSTVHVNKVSGIYSGKMTQDGVTPGTGGGSVPRDLALAAGLACDDLYVKGYEGNAASVALTWYRGSPQGPSPTDANFGRNSGPVFGGAGNWHTQGIVSPSIAVGDKFTIGGGFFTSNATELSEVPTTTVYRGSRVSVTCLPFMIVRHWPF